MTPINAAASLGCATVRPSIWVSDLYGAQQGHADLWQVCLAHQLRDCKYAVEAGDTVFAPRIKALLLRACVLARRRNTLAASTRHTYQYRLDRELNQIMGLAPTNPHGKRLRKRYGKVRNSLFSFLEHPDVPPDNNGSEREVRPTATYRKVTGGGRAMNHEPDRQLPAAGHSFAIQRQFDRLAVAVPASASRRDNDTPPVQITPVRSAKASPAAARFRRSSIAAAPARRSHRRTPF